MPSAHLTSLEGPKKNLASRTACTYLKPNRLSTAHPQSGSPGPLGKSPVRPCVVSVWCRAMPCGVVSHVSHDAGRTPVRTSAVRASALARCGTRPHAGFKSVAADFRCGVLRSLCGPELEPARTRTRTRTYPAHTPYEPVPTYGHEPVPEPVRTTDLNPYRTRT